jgi:3-phosphoshikimate 1-carboxyvinyltransferase
MRFLTAYSAIKGINKTMTGTERMKERPIGILVDALRQLGAKIEYLKNMVWKTGSIA